MVCECEFFNTLHGIGIKLDTFDHYDMKMCISFFYDDPQMWTYAHHFLVTTDKFFQELWPLMTLKIQFNIGYMVCEHEFNTLHRIGIKFDSFNNHNVNMCISFSCDNQQIFPRVMALDDLENSVYGLWAQILWQYNLTQI